MEFKEFKELQGVQGVQEVTRSSRSCKTLVFTLRHFLKMKDERIKIKNLNDNCALCIMHYELS